MIAQSFTVNLWIGVEGDANGSELCLQGRLSKSGIAELDRVTKGLAVPIRIDLSQLYSADEMGIKALQGLRDDGAELIAARPLLAFRLDEAESKANPEP